MLNYQRVVKLSNPHVLNAEIQREQDLKNADVVRPKDLEERDGRGCHFHHPNAASFRYPRDISAIGYTSGDLTSYL